MEQTPTPAEPVIESTPELEDDPLLDQEVTQPEPQTGDLTGTDKDETGGNDTPATES
ncbi:hypothetical protein [Arsenicibacter rosenii]|uniref:hypothetical protein n=1 Tax=Arsenicibacter rosenii TaxID=1750698 RepID=UPI0015A700E2|nr:hypothetical protein [Arsenicibacter rosenii]